MKPASLHLFPSRSWGGAEIYAVDLVRWLNQAGEHATLWCPKSSPMEKRALEYKLPLITEPLAQRSIGVSLPHISQRLSDLGADILHVHWSGGLWTTWGIKRWQIIWGGRKSGQGPVRKIYHTHMWMTYRKRDPFHRMAYSELDALLVAGPRARDLFQEVTTVPKERMYFSPYGIDFERISHLRPSDSPSRQQIKNEIRKDLEWNSDGFVIGYFGRIDRQKGVLEFCQSLSAVLSAYPKVKILLVGSPTLNEADAVEYHRLVENTLAENPYRDRIQRLSHTHEWEKLLAACDVLVTPSYHESYSILIATALAMGIPVLGTREGGTPDLIGAHEERGWLVQAQSQRDLQDKLLYICTNPDSLSSKSEAALIFAEKNNSHTNVVSDLVNLYANLRTKP